MIHSDCIDQLLVKSRSSRDILCDGEADFDDHAVRNTLVLLAQNKVKRDFQSM